MSNSFDHQKYILTTTRLGLRQMTMDDLNFVAKMLACADVMQYYPQVYNREEAAEWLERQLVRYREDGHGLWLVEDRYTGEPIGQVGVIIQQVEEQPIVEVGYLIDQPFWQKGYAIEAASACKEYAFSQLHAKVVHSLIRPANIPSQRVALRNGMKPIRLVTFKNLDHLLFGTCSERICIEQ